MSNSLMFKISAVAVAVGAAVMQIPSAEAQIVAVPVSGGGFVVRYDNAVGNYVTAPTFVTPVGTIAVTGTPSLPFWQGVTIDVTDTPIGVEIDNINGSVSLNDGRNATLNNSQASLQAIAKVTEGSEPFFPDEPTFGITTITANFRSGSINVPQSAFSALPAPQVVIPITNGTFTLNIPENQAAFPVITFNSVITPLGTANLTFSFPASVPSTTCGCRFFSSDEDRPADISVVVNGSVALSDGRTANINNRLFTFQANAKVTNPVVTDPSDEPFYYYVAEVPFEPYTVTGSFSNFNISIPASDISSITPPLVETPTIPTLLPKFQLTQSSDPNLVPLIIPDLDDSPLSKRRF